MSPSTEMRIQSLNGSWILDKTLSAGLEPILKLQSIGWLLRKTIIAAKVTVKITQSTEPDPSAAEPIQWLTVEQVVTGGIRAPPEKRPLTWTEVEHNNPIFGAVFGRFRLVNGVKDLDGKVRPDLPLGNTPVGNNTAAESIILSFLGGSIQTAEEGETSEANLEKAFLQEFVRSVKYGWTAEQIWALEEISGERFLTRKVVVVHGSSYECARVVYRYVDQN